MKAEPAFFRYPVEGVTRTVALYLARGISALIAAAALLGPGPAAAQLAYTYTVPYSFTGGADGKEPSAGLVKGSDGLLYGTTARGGIVEPACPQGCGTIFRVNANETVTTLFSFTASSTSGFLPLAELTLGNDGNLYGVAGEGGLYGAGTLFRLSPSGTFTVLHTFTGPDGDAPASRLLQLADGAFYGTTTYGGNIGANTGCGTVFRFDPATNAHTVLLSLGPPGPVPEGCGAAGGVTLTTDGWLVGTTTEGDATGRGIVYKLRSTGADPSLVHQFATGEGNRPLGELISGGDGWLYGTLQIGTSTTYGSVFRVKPNGSFSVVYVFDGSAGKEPTAGLALGPDGKLYGTTRSGGSYDCGTAFRMTRAGVLATLRNFEGCYPLNNDAARPAGTLFFSSSNTLWGTSTMGGSFGGGALFKFVAQP